jgi:hypothetical protein
MLKIGNQQQSLPVNCVRQKPLALAVHARQIPTFVPARSLDFKKQVLSCQLSVLSKPAALQIDWLF